MLAMSEKSLNTLTAVEDLVQSYSNVLCRAQVGCNQDHFAIQNTLLHIVTLRKRNIFKWHTLCGAQNYETREYHIATFWNRGVLC